MFLLRLAWLILPIFFLLPNSYPYDYLPVVRVRPFISASAGEAQAYCVVPFVLETDAVSRVQSYRATCFQSGGVSSAGAEKIFLVACWPQVIAAMKAAISSNYTLDAPCNAWMRGQLVSPCRAGSSVSGLVCALMPLKDFTASQPGQMPLINRGESCSDCSVCLLTLSQVVATRFALLTKACPDKPRTSCFEDFAGKVFVSPPALKPQEITPIIFAGFSGVTPIAAILPHQAAQFSLVPGPKTEFRLPVAGPAAAAADSEIEVRAAVVERPAPSRARNGRGVKARASMAAGAPAARVPKRGLQPDIDPACIACGVALADLDPKLAVMACLSPRCQGFFCASAGIAETRCQCGEKRFAQHEAAILLHAFDVNSTGKKLGHGCQRVAASSTREKELAEALSTLSLICSEVTIALDRYAEIGAAAGIEAGRENPAELITAVRNLQAFLLLHVREHEDEWVRARTLCQQVCCRLGISAAPLPQLLAPLAVAPAASRVPSAHLVGQLSGFSAGVSPAVSGRASR